MRRYILFLLAMPLLFIVTAATGGTGSRIPTYRYVPPEPEGAEIHAGARLYDHEFHKQTRWESERRGRPEYRTSHESRKHLRERNRELFKKQLERNRETFKSFAESEREQRKHQEEMEREARKHRQEMAREYRKHLQEMEREHLKHSMEVERE